MRRPLRIAGIVALATGAMLVSGGVVFTQVVLLSVLAVAVAVAAAAASIEQSFRLLEGSPLRKESFAPSDREGAALPR